MPQDCLYEVYGQCEGNYTTEHKISTSVSFAVEPEQLKGSEGFGVSCCSRALRLEKCFSRAPHKHTEPQITCLMFIKKYYSISVRSMQKMLSSEFPGASWSLNVHRNTATRLHQNTQYHRAFKE